MSKSIGFVALTNYDKVKESRVIEDKSWLVQVSVISLKEKKNNVVKWIYPNSSA